MKNYLLVPVIAVTLFAATSKPAQAFWPFDPSTSSGQVETTDSNVLSPVLEKLITTFNLDRTKVTETVTATRTQQRTERQAEMKTQFETRLNEAVKNGKLTEAQKTLITQKHEELQGQRDALRQWATDNGIDMSYFGQGDAPFGASFHGQGRGRGMMNR